MKSNIDNSCAKSGMMLILLAALTSCGASQTSTPQPRTGAANSTSVITSTSTSTTCTNATACSAVTVSLSWLSSQMVNKAIAVSTGTTVQISLSASAAGRNVLTFFEGAPTNARVTTGPNGTLSFCSGSVASGTIVGVGRDLTRCQMLESTPANCTLTTNSLPYDTRENVVWAAANTTNTNTLSTILTTLLTGTVSSVTSALGSWIGSIIGGTATSTPTCP